MGEGNEYDLAVTKDEGEARCILDVLFHSKGCLLFTQFATSQVQRVVLLWSLNIPDNGL